MKNILLVTSLYPIPAPENNCTYVCHYFARDWTMAGYNVVVIHVQPEYPILSHWLINARSKYKHYQPGGGYYYANQMKGEEHYTMDNVPVYRLPVYKLLPRFDFPKCSLSKFKKRVVDILKENNFHPDIIIGHMTSVELIPLINEHFGIKTCMISHGVSENITRHNIDLLKKYKDRYDIWGFRSVGILHQFTKCIGEVNNPFICYSGVPPEYIVTTNPHHYQGEINTFIYVGDFIERKYPSKLIDALAMSSVNDNFQLTYIGKGPLKESITSTAKKYGLSDRITFTGKIPRNNVTAYYDKSDCMIMISRGEAFGLVYLEAMARGCIVIASRDEGVDGVVIDGQNGFLCKAGDENELAGIIDKINKMSDSEKQQISENAINTARKFTDYNAAMMYLDSLKERI